MSESCIKVWQVLQSVTDITKYSKKLFKIVIGITKCASYYKVRCNTSLSWSSKQSGTSCDDLNIPEPASKQPIYVGRWCSMSSINSFLWKIEIGFCFGNHVICMYGNI